MSLVFDIETSAFGIETLTESQQEYILRYADKEKDESLRVEKQDEAIRYLNLYPFTSKVVAIGMLNTETNKSMILFEGEGEQIEIEDKEVIYNPLNEEEMLNYFWNLASKFDRVITFNGRLFDIPYMMLRSAVLKIKPTRNFISSRFNHSQHIDLLEEFTFHGMLKKFNLDFYCNSFGIESPKSKGITGMDINELCEAGRIDEIACYCHNDVVATFELYKIWNEFLRFE